MAAALTLRWTNKATLLPNVSPARARAANGSHIHPRLQDCLLLLRMTTEEAKIYSRTSLGLEAGDVWEFLDFLKDKPDKQSGMVDMTPDQDNKDSLMTPC
jgi:hypothetical protein